MSIINKLNSLELLYNNSNNKIILFTQNINNTLNEIVYIINNYNNTINTIDNMITDINKYSIYIYILFMSVFISLLL
jgi:hypothetical protein